MSLGVKKIEFGWEWFGRSGGFKVFPYKAF
jgi:hypothetical protein